MTLKFTPTKREAPIGSNSIYINCETTTADTAQWKTAIGYIKCTNFSSISEAFFDKGTRYRTVTT